MAGTQPVERSFRVVYQFLKADESLGLVMGFAVVCKEQGRKYFDLQGDHIGEVAMLKAATDFMMNSRAGKVMHRGKSVGQVVFAFPLTGDVAKAFELETKRPGLMIAWKPDDPKVIEDVKKGKYRGFSIGGTRGEDKDVDDDEADVEEAA